MITVLMGKSASGKDTLMQELINRFDFKPIVSTTSRPMRDGETNGKEYNFVSKEEFESQIEHGIFSEYRTYEAINDNGEKETWYYGSPYVNPDEDMYITILDVDGANEYIKEYGANNVIVLELECSDNVREQRARQRGSFNEEEWNRRLESDNKIFDKSNDKYKALKNTAMERTLVNKRVNPFSDVCVCKELSATYKKDGVEYIRTLDELVNDVEFEMRVRLIENAVFLSEKALYDYRNKTGAMTKGDLSVENRELLSVAGFSHNFANTEEILERIGKDGTYDDYMKAIRYEFYSGLIVKDIDYFGELVDEYSFDKGVDNYLCLRDIDTLNTVIDDLGYVVGENNIISTESWFEEAKEEWLTELDEMYETDYDDYDD